MIFSKPKTIHFKLFESFADADVVLPVNETMIVKAHGRKYCIAHTSEGIFAVDNSCPHDGGPLGHGYCTEKNEVICPWHRYHFDLRTGKETRGAGCYVETYPVETTEDGIFMIIPVRWWERF